MAQMVEHWTHAGVVVAPEDVPRDQIAREEVRAQATIGDAAPLGLLGFATGTFTLSAIATGWFGRADIPYAVPVVLVFAGIAQFIAGMYMLRKSDTFAATAFMSFGAFNTVFAFYFLLLHPATVGGTATAAPIVGTWIGCFAYIAFMLFWGAMKRNWALAIVLIALAATYGFLAASVFAPSVGVLLTIAGWCGIASSIAAFYTATAMVLNGEMQRVIVPMGTLLKSPSDVSHDGHQHVVRETVVREPAR